MMTPAGSLREPMTELEGTFYKVLWAARMREKEGLSACHYNPMTAPYTLHRQKTLLSSDKPGNVLFPNGNRKPHHICFSLIWCYQAACWLPASCYAVTLRCWAS